MERSKNTNVFQRNKRRFIILLLAMTAATAMANTPTSGGVVGRNFGTVENGYSDGLVIGSPSNIGGLVGTNSGGTITNSFFDSQRSGQSDNDGRGIPRTTAQMRQQATFALWNLQNIWGMEALTYNGNPFLRTFYPLSRAQITIEGQRVPTNNSTSTVLVNNIGIMPHNTGNPIQPNVQIEHNGQPLTQGTDFQLEFSDNTALSTNTNPARMSIIGMGDYAGTTIGYNFFITDPRDIRTTTVSSIPDQIHRGTQQIRPQVVVRDFNNQLILQEDADYFLDFGANNTIGNNAGSVRIIGDGIYQGEERTVRFNIVEARPINTTNTTIAAINDLAFNWQAQTPQPTITHSQFGILTEGVDFYFTYENNINRGSATIRVNGMGYFAGSVSRTFTILPRHINTVNITPIPEQAFVPGQPATPALTIKDGETNYLVLGRDFTVSYNRNDAPSTEGNLARAIVSGTNNFSGTRTENFVISGGNITIAEISVVWREPLTFMYNGQEQHPTATAVCPDGLPVLLSINTGNARNAREAAYVATASILTGNPRFHLVLNPQTASVEFHITRAPISPTLNIASIRAGETLSPQVIGNSGGGTVRIYYSTSDSENGTWSTTPFTTQGTYFARAVIEQSQNYLGATTAPVPFAITGTNPTPIPVVWGTQITFTYNGQEQSPTATATLDGTTFPLVITGAINANATGETHTATARLATPNVNYELTNATRTFTIAARSLSENAIDPIGNFPFTGTQIRPDFIVVRDGTQRLVEGIDYTLDFGANISGIGTVIVRGIGNYSETSTRSFIISSEGATVVQIVWDEENTNFTFSGQEQYPKVLSSGGVEIEILGKQTNAGSFTAVARLATENPNIILANASMPFTIAPKNLTVNWDADTIIVFNWQAQRPNARARDQERGVNIPIGVFHNLNGATANNILADEYSVVAMIIACSQDNHVNYRLTTGSVEHKYKIEKRPINVVIEQTADVRLQLSATEEKDTITVLPILFANRANLQALIYTLLDFDNFATDPSNGETDDISVFGDKRPTVRIIDIPEAEIEESSRFGRSDDLVRYRLYLLRIETEGMLAENYQIGATEFFIRTEEFLPNFIRQNTSRDSRYGIILENAVVSDFARISVITPEPATINLAIFDNLGNVVFSANDVRAGFKPAPTADGAIVWNLQNQSGRFVANGTYLVIVEATGISGRRFTYSARIGVNK